MKDKQKILNRIFRYLFTLLFITYLTLYFSMQTGYYEYETRKKNQLTEEQIIKFEEDVKKGKNIKLEDYLKETEVDYGNQMSQIGKNFSLQVSNAVQNGIEKIFSQLNKIASE